GVTTVSCTTGTTYVALSNGNGTFAPANSMALSGLDNWVTVSDVNGDGRGDLIKRTGNTFYVYKSNGNGTFGASEAAIVGTGPYLATADVNGDGKQDLLLSSAGTTQTYLRSAAYPDLLTTITNSLGGTTTVTYKASSAYANTNNPPLQQTISS